MKCTSFLGSTIRQPAILVAAIALLGTGCGASDDLPSDSAHDGTNGAGDGVGGGSSAPESSIEPESSGERPAPESPNEQDRSFIFVQPDFTVDPADEWTWCYRYPIPEEHRTTGPMYVTGFESDFSEGTHHYFAYYNGDPRPETLVDEPTPCFDDGPRGEVIDPRAEKYKDGPGITFGAPRGPNRYFLPPGFAYELPSTEGYFLTDHHVFNPSPDEMTISGWMRYYYAPPEAITHVLNMVTCTVGLIHISPYSSATVRGTCIAKEPLVLQVLASHAHLYLTRFSQYVYDGSRTLPEPIYESFDWDSPVIKVLDEPIHLEPGQGFTVQCEYENATSNTVLPGVGEAGEMCVGMNLFYRASDPRNTPTAGGLILFSGGRADIEPGENSCGPFGSATCRN